MFWLNVITLATLLLMFGTLYFRKSNVLPNRVLAFILLVPCVNFLSNLVIISGNLQQFAALYFLGQVTGFIFGPLVHMYSILMTGNRINYRYWLYFVSMAAMIAAILVGINFALAKSPGEQDFYLLSVQKGPYPADMVIMNSIFILLQQIYFTICAVMVFRYRKQLQNTLSNFETTRVTYITRFIQLIWLLNIITLFSYAVLPTVDVEYAVLPVVLTLISVFILYYAFRYQSVFTKSGYQHFLLRNTLASAHHPMDPALSPEPLIHPVFPAPDQTAGNEISNHIKTWQLHLQPSLKLADLAESLQMPEEEITRSIRKDLNTSFYDLVNKIRVAHAAELIQKGRTISPDLARDTGFSKVSSLTEALEKYKSRSNSPTYTALI